MACLADEEHFDPHAKVPFDINSDTFPRAALEFFRQSKVEVLFLATPDLYAIHTQPVKGLLDPQEALEVMLKGTGLIYQWAAPNSVAFRQPERPRIQFDIPAGTAASTLPTFADQAHLNLRFSTNRVGDQHTNAVTGNLEPLDALKRMLTGSGLRYSFQPPDSFVVSVEPIVTDESRSYDKYIPPITITGSKFEPYEVTASPGSEQVVVGYQDIRIAGAQTAQEALRSVPQIWHGGPQEDTYIGIEALQNVDKASGVNIRGLDASATLVLFNGHRVAPSGTAGSWTDIANFPVSALDHIQLLLDADVLPVGGDAIGGVANFVVKSHFSGAETDLSYGHVSSGPMGELRIGQLFGGNWGSATGFAAMEYYHRDALPSADRAQATSNLTRWQGSNFDIPFGNPGTLLTGTQSYAIPHGQSGSSLTAAALVPGQNLYDQWSGADLEPRQTHLSAVGTLQVDFADAASLSFDALAGEREVRLRAHDYYGTLEIPATNPFIPKGVSDPIFVEYGFSKDLGQQSFAATARTGNLAVTLDADLGHSWAVLAQAGSGIELQNQTIRNIPNFEALNAALADPNALTAFNPFGDGSFTAPTTLAQIRSQTHFDSDSQIQWINASISGAALTLPAGAANLLAGLEYRRQIVDSHEQTAASGTTTDLGRRVDSSFLELRVPLSDRSSRAGSFEVSGGIRTDRYSDAGEVWLPQFTARWKPQLDSLTVKASWGRSAKPPDLPDLNTQQNLSTLFTLPDANSPTGSSTVLAANGGNPGIKTAEAKSWTLGFDAAPGSLPGTSLGLTYFNTNFSNKVESTDLEYQILNDPAFSYAVIRNPSPAQRAAVCQSSTFIGGAQSSCTTADVAALVDVRYHNVAWAGTSGADMYLQYAKDSRIGRWDFGALGTYILRYEKQQNPDSPRIDFVNTQTNPLKFRGRAFGSWRFKSFGVVTTINYSGSYRDVASQPGRPVKSWTTADLRLAYSWLNLEIALSVKDVGNSMSPFVNNSAGTVGYDQENGSLLGRMSTLEIRLRR